MQGFLRRYPELLIREPEATSKIRTRGFNKVAVIIFITIPEELVEKYHFTAQQIYYKVDETGITVVPKGASKIIALTGKRQVCL